MKICCIADIHENYDFEVPDCDLVLIAGDIFGHPSVKRQLFWMNKFSVFVGNLDKRGIQWLMTPGNHDTMFEPDHCFLIPDSIKHRTLVDAVATVDDMLVYGSPWQKRFYDWSFNLDEPDLERKWSMIPDDTEILLLHSPPFGILDVNLGSPSLTARIKNLKKLKLCVFGHIHYGHGHKIIDGVHFVNAAMCDNRNKLIHEPTMIEI
jgi:Icc-related predicted phosphoesterase